MPIIIDHYFWLALDYVFGGIAALVFFVTLGLRYKRLGVYTLLACAVIGWTYILVQTSNLLAYEMRATTRQDGSAPMTWDAKDRAIIAASALVGYCQSSAYLGEVTPETLVNWVNGLREYVDTAVTAINAAMEEFPTTRPGGEGTP